MRHWTSHAVVDECRELFLPGMDGWLPTQLLIAVVVLPPQLLHLVVGGLGRVKAGDMACFVQWSGRPWCQAYTSGSRACSWKRRSRPRWRRRRGARSGWWTSGRRNHSGCPDLRLFCWMQKSKVEGKTRKKDQKRKRKEKEGRRRKGRKEDEGRKIRRRRRRNQNANIKSKSKSKSNSNSNSKGIKIKKKIQIQTIQIQMIQIQNHVVIQNSNSSSNSNLNSTSCKINSNCNRNDGERKKERKKKKRRKKGRKEGKERLPFNESRRRRKKEKKKKKKGRRRRRAVFFFNLFFSFIFICDFLVVLIPIKTLFDQKWNPNFLKWAKNHLSFFRFSEIIPKTATIETRLCKKKRLLGGVFSASIETPLCFKNRVSPVGGHLLDPLFFMIGGIPATFSLSSHFLVFIAIWNCGSPVV